MRIINPQSAALTNVEVLAYLTANPPRRPPDPPPNVRNWIPSPDLRDHNTVVKEIHNYVDRLAPHILTYPRYIHLENQGQQDRDGEGSDREVVEGKSVELLSTPAAAAEAPAKQPNTLTPMDNALRLLISRLRPFGLTKAEVLMIVNLGIGTHGARPDGGDLNPVNNEGNMDVDNVENTGEEGEGQGEGEEEDYGPLALLDTVIEEREERLSTEDAMEILKIIRDTLGPATGD